MRWSKFVQDVTDDFHCHGAKKPVAMVRTFLFNPRFRLLLNYRLGAFLMKRRTVVRRILAGYLKRKQISKYGCDISYYASIGRRVKFAHPIGIVIGYGAVIEGNATIWQHVTLGSHGRVGMRKEYPVIKPGVRIFANAIVAGGVTVGRNATIAASAVVMTDVPDNKLAIGNPAVIKG